MALPGSYVKGQSHDRMTNPRNITVINKKKFSLLLSTIVLPLFALAGTPIFSESFDTADSINAWVGGPAWNGTAGNPGGAVVVSNNIQPTNKNFTIDIPLEFEEKTDLTINFDAISLANFAGVFHFYAEPEGFPQFFINFNVEALINDSSHTALEFVVADVPASASYLTLRFEMITGAVIEAEVSIAVDNLIVSGPTIDPEGTWKGYELVDGFWAENVGQLGWINVEFDPWLWSDYLGEWVYMPEDSVPGTEGVWFYMGPSD
jgi:hypothetical protein